MIEVLVVIGVLFFVAALSAYFSIPYIQKSKLESVADDISSRAFRHQQNAVSGYEGKSYGIRFRSDGFDLFTGESYATAESVENFGFQGGVYISSINFADGGNEVVFLSGTLQPSTTGSIGVYNDTEAYQVSFNSEGSISTVSQ